MVEVTGLFDRHGKTRHPALTTNEPDTAMRKAALANLIFILTSLSKVKLNPSFDGKGRGGVPPPRE